MKNPFLDILIPVYNEGENIRLVLESLFREVKTPFRVVICYDQDDDTTLLALESEHYPCDSVITLKNTVASGPHGAVRTGFNFSHANAIIVLPADDTFNASVIDAMWKNFNEGSEIVCASRFIPGGCMEGCPWIKASLVRVVAFTLYQFAGLPTRDATNGFRLFSKRLLESIQLESTLGFTYSIELLVKCSRLGWKVTEVPARWYGRTKGTSRFRVWKWMIPYLKWYFYAFQTKISWFRRKPVY